MGLSGWVGISEKPEAASCWYDNSAVTQDLNIKVEDYDPIVMDFDRVWVRLAGKIDDLCRDKESNARNTDGEKNWRCTIWPLHAKDQSEQFMHHSDHYKEYQDSNRADLLGISEDEG